MIEESTTVRGVTSHNQARRRAPTEYLVRELVARLAEQTFIKIQHPHVDYSAWMAPLMTIANLLLQEVVAFADSANVFRTTRLTTAVACSRLNPSTLTDRIGIPQSGIRYVLPHMSEALVELVTVHETINVRVDQARRVIQLQAR